MTSWSPVSAATCGCGLGRSLHNGLGSCSSPSHTTLAARAYGSCRICVSLLSVLFYLLPDCGQQHWGSFLFISYVKESVWQMSFCFKCMCYASYMSLLLFLFKNPHRFAALCTTWLLLCLLEATTAIWGSAPSQMATAADGSQPHDLPQSAFKSLAMLLKITFMFLYLWHARMIVSVGRACWGTHYSQRSTSAVLPLSPTATTVLSRSVIASSLHSFLSPLRLFLNTS